MKKILTLALIFFNFSAFARENVFVAKKENGEIVDLRKNFGKKTVIVIFASWCKFCHQEMLKLQKEQVYKGVRGIKIIAINLDEVDDEKDYLAFAKKFSFDFVKFSDISYNSFIAKPDSLPSFYFINEKLELVEGF